MKNPPTYKSQLNKYMKLLKKRFYKTFRYFLILNKEKINKLSRIKLSNRNAHLTYAACSQVTCSKR